MRPIKKTQLEELHEASAPLTLKWMVLFCITFLCSFLESQAQSPVPFNPNANYTYMLSGGHIHKI